MTQEKITLALREALLDWFDLKKIAEKFPKSSVARNKAQRKLNEVQELEKMLKEITEAK
jgi:hypothetical protein|nr:MAG TPA: hypothetical protein [Caudoviricetes sp.]